MVFPKENILDIMKMMMSFIRSSFESGLVEDTEKKDIVTEELKGVLSPRTWEIDYCYQVKRS